MAGVYYQNERFFDKDEATRLAQEAHESELHTATPVIIEENQDKQGTVTVNPALKLAYLDDNGKVAWKQIPTIKSAPVLQLGGGGFSLTLPVKKGDEGLAIFAERGIDAWWAKGGIQNQDQARMHSITDAMIIPGFRSQPNKLKNINTTSMQMRTDDGKTNFDFNPTGGGTMTMTAPNNPTTIQGKAFDTKVETSTQKATDNIKLDTPTTATTGNLNVAKKLTAGQGLQVAGGATISGGLQVAGGISGAGGGPIDLPYVPLAGGTMTGPLYISGLNPTRASTTSGFGPTYWVFPITGADDAAAGSITFRIYDPNALGIVGAGIGPNRKIMLWDNVTVVNAFSAWGAVNFSSTLDVTGATALRGGLVVTAGGATISGGLNVTNGSISIGGTPIGTGLPYVPIAGGTMTGQLNVSSAIASIGANSILVFADRAGGNNWGWYASGGLVRLNNGADRFYIDSSGNVTANSYSGVVSYLNSGFWAGTALSAGNNRAANYYWEMASIACQDLRGVAAGVGAGISFMGRYTSTAYADFGGIYACKQNGNIGDYTGNLNLWARNAGGAMYFFAGEVLGGGLMASLAVGALTVPGTIFASGSGSMLQFSGRDGTPTWGWYATANVARLWISNIGDRFTVDSAGSVVATGHVSAGYSFWAGGNLYLGSTSIGLAGYTGTLNGTGGPIIYGDANWIVLKPGSGNLGMMVYDVNGTARAYMRADGSFWATGVGSPALGQFRMMGTTTGAGYGSGWYNDQSSTYLLLTNSGDAMGTYNGLRPFVVTMSNGYVTMGHGVQISNGLALYYGGITIYQGGGGGSNLRFYDDGNSHVESSTVLWLNWNGQQVQCNGGFYANNGIAVGAGFTANCYSTFNGSAAINGRLVVFQSGASDPLEVGSDYNMHARTYYHVHTQRIWTCGVLSDSSFRISDESGAATRMQMNVGGDTIFWNRLVNYGDMWISGAFHANGGITIDGGMTIGGSLSCNDLWSANNLNCNGNHYMNGNYLWFAGSGGSGVNGAGGPLVYGDGNYLICKCGGGNLGFEARNYGGARIFHADGGGNIDFPGNLSTGNTLYCGAIVMNNTGILYGRDTAGNGQWICGIWNDNNIYIGNSDRNIYIRSNYRIRCTNELWSQGGSAGFIFADRTDGFDWQWYATASVARLWDSGYGDRLTVDRGGSLTAVGNVRANGSVGCNGIWFGNNGGWWWTGSPIHTDSAVEANAWIHAGGEITAGANMNCWDLHAGGGLYVNTLNGLVNSGGWWWSSSPIGSGSEMSCSAITVGGTYLTNYDGNWLYSAKGLLAGGGGLYSFSNCYAAGVISCSGGAITASNGRINSQGGDAGFFFSNRAGPGPGYWGWTAQQSIAKLTWDGTNDRMFFNTNGDIYPYTSSTSTCGNYNWWNVISNNFSPPSDPRLKRDIELAPSALDRVCAIPAVTYRWRKGNDTEKRHHGWLSTDVRETMGDHWAGVIYNPDMGVDCISLNQMTAVLWKAVQELTAEVRELKSELKSRLH